MVRLVAPAVDLDGGEKSNFAGMRGVLETGAFAEKQAEQKTGIRNTKTFFIFVLFGGEKMTKQRFIQFKG